MIINHGEQHVSTVKGKKGKVKGFRQLLSLLAQDNQGLNDHVYTRLRVGDVWWIPDNITGFGQKERHPWVIVRAYSSGRANVIACPRTSAVANSSRGIITPANILPGLTQEGLFILKHRRSLAAKDFRDFEYIGQLSRKWIRMIQSFYKTGAR